MTSGNMACEQASAIVSEYVYYRAKIRIKAIGPGLRMKPLVPGLSW
jgi:hypothetical protein